MVTIVVPNHNEPQIDQTLSGLLTLGCPVVVSNDPLGKGVGWAMREGLKEVQTEWVLFAMADASEDRSCLLRMIDLTYMEGIDAIYGDRWGHGGSVQGYPRWKRILNRLANHAISLLTGDPYTDWTDPAKAYKTARLRRIAWSDDFRSAVEMPLRYAAQAPIVVPMHWRERTAGESAYKFSHALGCLRALLTVVIHG